MALASSTDIYALHVFDDYEYEYDETATDNFYFTLDLDAHVPKSANVDSAPPKVPPSGVGAADFVDDDHVPEAGRIPASETEQGSVGDLQVIELHSRNPIVKLDDKIFSCYWSTDLGTQFHVAKAGVCTSPKKAGNVLDIVGTSQTRLIGRPVTLQRRSHAPSTAPGQEAEEGDTAEAALWVSDDSSGEEQDLNDPNHESATPETASATIPNAETQQSTDHRSNRALNIPRDLVKTAAGAAQATFLESLSRIKIRKKETDMVPMYSIKHYEPPSPSKQLEIRERAIEQEAAQKRQREESQANTVMATKKRVQRRRPAYVVGSIPESADNIDD